MTSHEQSCHRLLAGWCKNKAIEERKLVGRCRTAYREPILGGLTNRYADTLEAAAKLFEDLGVELERAITATSHENPFQRHDDGMK